MSQRNRVQRRAMENDPRCLTLVQSERKQLTGAAAGGSKEFKLDWRNLLTDPSRMNVPWTLGSDTND
jgi:hypothetical protein